MPIIKSAKKALRSSLRKRVFNLRRQDTMRDLVKKVRKNITLGNKDAAQALMSQAYQAIDKAAKGGVIKANTASRKKSRLTAALRKLG